MNFHGYAYSSLKRPSTSDPEQVSFSSFLKPKSVLLPHFHLFSLSPSSSHFPGPSIQKLLILFLFFLTFFLSEQFFFEIKKNFFFFHPSSNTNTLSCNQQWIQQEASIMEEECPLNLLLTLLTFTFTLTPFLPLPPSRLLDLPSAHPLPLPRPPLPFKRVALVPLFTLITLPTLPSSRLTIAPRWKRGESRRQREPETHLISPSPPLLPPPPPLLLALAPQQLLSTLPFRIPGSGE